MSYQIITDSCCDFTEEQLQKLQVSCANLTVLYNGENHSNFSDPTAVKASAAARAASPPRPPLPTPTIGAILCCPL